MGARNIADKFTEQEHQRVASFSASEVADPLDASIVLIAESVPEPLTAQVQPEPPPDPSISTLLPDDTGEPDLPSLSQLRRQQAPQEPAAEAVDLTTAKKDRRKSTACSISCCSLRDSSQK